MARHLLSLILTLALLCVPASLGATPSTQQDILGHESRTAYVRAKLRTSGIISDVIDDFHPSTLVEIDYPSSHESVSLGNDINPKHVQTKPVVLLHAAEESGGSNADAIFTVILTDPDAPSRGNPEWSEMCHWIATNITSMGTGDYSSDSLSIQVLPTIRQGPEELVEYFPPGPPPKTGPHRYVFLVFKSKDGKKRHLSVPEDRKHWGTGKSRHGVRDWADKNGLVPVGGNFFYAQNAKQ